MKEDKSLSNKETFFSPHTDLKHNCESGLDTFVLLSGRLPGPAFTSPQRGGSAGS